MYTHAITSVHPHTVLQKMNDQSQNFNVDNLTLQFFTNKQTYKKYLAKRDPDAYEKKQMDFDQWRENSTEILEIVQEGLESPDDILPKSLRDAFHHFAKEALLLIEKRQSADEEKETRRKNTVEDEFGEKCLNEKDKEEETLFSQVEDLQIEPKNPIEYWKMQKVFKKK